MAFTEGLGVKEQIRMDGSLEIPMTSPAGHV